MYERILECINEVQYSHRRDFKKKKRRQGRKIHVVRDQHLKRPLAWEWAKCAFTPQEAAHFELVEEPPTRPRGTSTWRYVFREPWRYVLRVRPNVITKIRQHDEDLEAELEAIRSYLERNNLWNRLYYLLDGSSNKSRWRTYQHKDVCYPGRHPFRNVPLHKLLATD